MSRILIIDDDFTHLSSTRGILEAEGHDVRTHDQGFGSTNKAAEMKPDLVLLDINMPGLSGNNLAAVFKADPRTRNIPLVLYSSNDEDSLRTTVRRLALEGYITKGSPAELRSRVASFLTKKAVY